MERILPAIPKTENGHCKVRVAVLGVREGKSRRVDGWFGVPGMGG